MKSVIVYTQPGCKNCETLKSWLKAKKLKFKEKTFDTEAQVEMIMKNVFGDPPYLQVEDKVLCSNEMFESGIIIESAIKRCMNG